MITFENVTFAYPGEEDPAIQDVNLTVNSGEFVLVIGDSGSGKSTLLRCINGLVPHFSGGVISGKIDVFGLDPVKRSPEMMNVQVGSVFQDPESQFIVDRVEDEIAFGLEHASIPRDEMIIRVNRIMELMELTSLRDRRLETLSGGECQRLAIASTMVLQPRVLVLDEPTSQLDPFSANELLDFLVKLKTELQLTIVLAEHRIERVLPYCDRIIFLESGKSGIIEGKPQQVLKNIPLVPPLVELGKSLGWEPLPLSIEEARSYLQRKHLTYKITKDNTDYQTTNSISNNISECIIRVQNINVWLGKKQVINNLTLDIRSGEICVLMGRNGVGKTTLLRTIMGILKPKSGMITIDGEEIQNKIVADISQVVGYLPQDPNTLLFADRVIDELMITLKNHDLSTEEFEPEKLIEILGLKDKINNYPRDLSVGERQRVALGSITVTKPRALLLDEPTRGLDYQAKSSLIKLLKGWRDDGMAILLVTHDVEMAAKIADRVVIIEAGCISQQGDPVDVLSGSAIFCPQIAQLFSKSGWLTTKDAVEGLAKTIN